MMSVSLPKAREPRRSEIQQSIFLPALIEKCDLRDDSQNPERMIDFINAFTDFVQQEPNKRVKEYYTHDYASILIETVLKISDPDISLNACKALRIANDYVPLDVDELTTLFIGLVLKGIHAKGLFASLFASKRFSKEFAKTGKFQHVFSEIFVNAESLQMCEYANQILFANFRNKSFKHVDFQKFMNDTLPIICSFKIEEPKDQAAGVFYATLFQEVSKYKEDLVTMFSKNDGFAAFDLLISMMSPYLKAVCYSTLLESHNDDMSSPPNLMVLFHIYRLFIHQRDMQKYIFGVIHESLKAHPQCVNRMNRAIAFSSWFEADGVSEMDMINMIQLIDACDGRLVKDVIPFFFKKLSTLDAEKIDKMCYMNCLQIIERRKFSLTFLNESEFLTHFVINTTPDMCGALLNDYELFAQLIIDVFNLEETSERRETVIQSLLRIADNWREVSGFDSLLATLLNSAAEESNMNMVMERVQSSNDLLPLLHKIFIKSGACCQLFVRLGGISILEKLPFDEQVSYLAELVSHGPIDEIEEYVLGFEDIKPEQLEQLVYGSNTCKYRRIVIPKLCSRMQIEKEKLDPFNAKLIADSLHLNLPYVVRVQTSVEVVRSLINDAQTDISQYMDADMDPFSLYEFFPDDELTMLSHGNGVSSCSFWWKISEQCDDWTIFAQSREIIVISTKKDKVRVEFCGGYASVKVQIGEWNYISMNKNSIQINEEVIQVKETPLSFDEFSFSGMKDNMLLITGLIYSNSAPENVFGKGPSFIDYVPPQEHSNVEVKYCGFGLHLLSPDVFRDVVERLRAITDSSEFTKTLRSLVGLMSRRGNFASNLWISIFDLMDERSSEIEQDFVIDTAYSLAKTWAGSVNALRDIVFRKQFDNSKVLCVLLSRFGSSMKWSDLYNFDMFVARVIRRERDSELFALVVKYIPTAAACLLSCIDNDTVFIVREIAKFVKNVPVMLPFNALRTLFISSDREMKIELLRVLCNVQSYDKCYSRVDTLFAISAAPLASVPELWDIIICDGLEPIVLAFIWAGILSVVHATAHGREIPAFVHDKVKLGAAFLKQTKLMANKCTSDFVRFVLPFAMNYHILFGPVPVYKAMQKKLVVGSQTPVDFVHDGLAKTLRVRSEDLSGVELPDAPVLSPGIQILSEAISGILEGFGYSHEFGSDIRIEMFVNMIQEDHIFDIFMDILGETDYDKFGQALRGLMLANLCFDQTTGRLFASHYIHKVVNHVKTVAQICQCISFLLKAVAGSLLEVNTLHLISDAMILAKKLIKDEKRVFERLKPALNAICFDLVVATPAQSLQFLLTFLETHMELFREITSYDSSWAYVFSSTCDFCRSKMISFVTKYYGKDHPQITEIIKKQVYMSKVPPREQFNTADSMEMREFFEKISQASSQVTYTKASQTVTTEHIFAIEEKRLEHMQEEAYETNEWRRLCNALRDASHNEQILSPFISPDRVPRVTMKCPVFDHQLVSQQSEVPMIAHKRGQNIISINCQLIRYSTIIDCVAVCLPSTLVIITNARMSDKSIELFSAQYPKSFVADLIMGNYGQIRMFRSHPIIIIKGSDVMQCTRLLTDKVQIWSSTNGSFVIKTRSAHVIYNTFPFGSTRKPSTPMDFILNAMCATGKSFFDFSTFPTFTGNREGLSMNRLCGLEDTEGYTIPMNWDLSSVKLLNAKAVKVVRPNRAPWTSYKTDMLPISTRAQNIRISVNPAEYKLVLSVNESSTTIYSSLFNYTTSVSLSSNGRFLSVDYSFGLTKIFVLNDGKLQLLVELCVGPGQRSRVSNEDLLCTISYQNTLRTFVLMTGAEGSSVKFDSDIVSHDLDINGIWLATQTRGFLLDFGCNILVEKEIGITSLAGMNDTDGCVAVTSSSGELFIMNDSFEARRKMETKNETKLCDARRCGDAIVVRDEISGQSLQWQMLL